jgi:anti-sigma B factor antagonist
MFNENIQIVSSNGTIAGQKILHLKGPLTIHTVFEFQDAVRKEEPPALIVDFSGVPYIDSAGLGALVGAYIGAQRATRKIAFSGMNPQVKALIDMTHVAKIFPTFDTVQDAEVAIS